MVLKIAFRSMFRQRRRTLLTMLTMFGGFVLCSFSIAFMDGSYNNVINMFTRNQLGQIQIHQRRYVERPTLFNAIDRYEEVGAALDKVAGVEAWAPRLYSAALASVGNNTSGVRVVGVDPVRENATTRFDAKVSEGAPFSPTPSHEALLGGGLARRLKASVGDEVVIVSQASDGSIANDVYTVIGTIDSGNEMDDKFALYLTLDDAQDLFVLEGRVHEIAVVSGNVRKLGELAGTIRGALGREDLVVETWQQFARSFYDAMQADQKGNWISLVIIVTLVAIGVLNTVLMSVLERTREYGLLRAVGTSARQVFALVVLEAAMMALLSSAAGFVAGLAVNYAFSVTGFPIPEVTYGGVTFRHMYTEINTRSFVIPLLAVVLSAALISVFPALKAARTRPAVAMRYH